MFCGWVIFLGLVIVKRSSSGTDFFSLARVNLLNGVVTLCNRPAALDAPVRTPTTITYTSVYMSMLTDFIIIKGKSLALLTDAQKEIWAGEVMVGKSMR